MKACTQKDCSDWYENMDRLSAALLLAHSHGFAGLKKSFNYCPYYGHNLEETESQKSTKMQKEDKNETR